MKETKHYTVGSNRGKTRIWIQGQILKKFGWEKSTPFNVTIGDGVITYSKSKDGARKVAGDENRPVIDTNSHAVGKTLGEAGTKVEVTFSRGKITITA